MTRDWSDLLVRPMSRLEVNHLELTSTSVRKTRRFGMGFAISVGNVYFELADAPFRMFPSVRDWIAWEARMYALLHGVAIKEEPAGFVAPRLPGLDGARLLAAGRLGDEELVAAAHALHALHEQAESHGDANLGNLLFEGGLARLVDFDAHHLADASLGLRAADDLLGLMLDLLGRTEEAVWTRASRVFLDAYAPTASVLEHLRRLAAPESFLARSLLRARARGAPEVVVRRRLGDIEHATFRAR